jgi:WD40 repeat protein
MMVDRPPTSEQESAVHRNRVGSFLAVTLQIGPPVLLRETASDRWLRASWLPDGRTLAVLEKTSSPIALVDSESLQPARNRVQALSSPWGSRMTSIAISPDGRWAAAGGWDDARIDVWDLPRRRLERILPAGDSLADSRTLPAFSPGGQWLVVCSHVAAASGFC